MTKSANEARIAPLPPEAWSDEVRAILTAELGPESPLGAAQLGELNLFTTVARHSRPFKSWLALGRQLVVRAALPFADRELAILRIGWLCRSPYEWGQHVRIAAAGGIPRAIVDRVPSGPGADGWDDRQRLLLHAVDELHADSRISDTTWEGLSGHLDEQQLIELPMLVGYYHLVAFTLGSLAIQPEPGLEPLPAS